MSRVAHSEVSGARKLQEISAVLRAVRAVTRQCLERSIQGLLLSWIEQSLAGDPVLSSPWTCRRCGASQRGSFRRNGSYRRQLATLAGDVALDVPRLRCSCGAHVSVVFPILEPRRRHWWDVWLHVIEGLGERVSVNAYEHPARLAERVHLTRVGDYFPHATGTGRDVDLDHPDPYREHGPPGQTGTHNSGPLGRRHHRWKTHAGYRARQCGAGRYVWMTPHGLGFLVDHHGTRRISNHEAQLILDAPPGVDIYPG